MADDDAALMSRILLQKAGNRRSIKSFMPAKIEDDADSYEEVEDEKLEDIQGGNDLTGVGVTIKVTEDENPDRQMLSTNDALRRKLLSSEAYKKFNNTKKHQFVAAKPMPRPVTQEINSDSDGEKKGKATKIKQKGEVADSHRNEDPAVIPSKPKKRAGSYLDQLLAERGKKKRKG